MEVSASVTAKDLFAELPSASNQRPGIDLVIVEHRWVIKAHEIASWHLIILRVVFTVPDVYSEVLEVLISVCHAIRVSIIEVLDHDEGVDVVCLA